MIKKKIIVIALLFLVGPVCAMDCKLDSQGTKTEEVSIKSLPKELLEWISRDVIMVNENLDQAIKSFKSFAQVLALSKTIRINLFDEEYKKIDIIKLFSTKFRVSPFIVARKLGIKLTDELLKAVREQILEAMDSILKRHDITSDEIEAWYIVFKDSADKIFKEFVHSRQINQRETLIAMAAALTYANADLNIQTKCGKTALMRAAWREIKETVALLLNGDDSNIEYELTALIKAVMYNGEDIVALLLNSGADPNMQDKYGNTALLIATLHNYKDIVALLLNAGSDSNMQDKDGYTALMGAANHGYKDIVELLLKAGADPNIQDKWGETALMFAGLPNKKDIVELLLKAGANPNIKSCYTARALDYAAEHPAVIVFPTGIFLSIFLIATNGK